MTVVDHVIATDDVTEGWECFGTTAGRNDHRFGNPPVLRPITVGWSYRELRDGIRVIEVCADMEDPADAYVKVKGSSAKSVYETWWRVAASVANGDVWMPGEPF